MAGNNGSKTNGLKVIGKPWKKVDAAEKCTGQTQFADDIFLPRMLHCKLLRSTVPHALIKNIDASKAGKHPGVKAVLLGSGICPPCTASCRWHRMNTPWPLTKSAWWAIPSPLLPPWTKMRPRKPCDRIDVEYELLPAIASVQQALDNPEPRIHEYGEYGNVHRRIAYEFGNMEEGFAEADFHPGRHLFLRRQHAPAAGTARQRSPVQPMTASSRYGAPRRTRTICTAPWPKCWASPPATFASLPLLAGEVSEASATPLTTTSSSRNWP